LVPDCQEKAGRPVLHARSAFITPYGSEWVGGEGLERRQAAGARTAVHRAHRTAVPSSRPLACILLLACWVSFWVLWHRYPPSIKLIVCGGGEKAIVRCVQDNRTKQTLKQTDTESQNALHGNLA